MSNDRSLEPHAAKPLPRSFIVTRATGFSLAQYAPPAFVVEGLIPVGHVTLLGAHGGAGKSQLALTIAAHCAAGRNWAGLLVAPRAAVFVSLEDSAQLILSRLKPIVETYGLDAALVEQGLTILDGSNGQAALAKEVSLQGTRQIMPTASMDEMRQLVCDAGLIVVDNASDAFDGDENDRRQVRGFMRMLTQIARDNDAAVLLLAHIDKAAAKFGAAGNSYSGSTAWHNSARSRLSMIQNDRGLELRQEKLNIGKAAEAIKLTWTEGGLLIPSITKADDNPEAQRNAEVAEDDARVLAAIEAALAAGVDVPNARTGPANTFGFLRTFPELGNFSNSRHDKDRFWGAMSRLEKAGEIAWESYRDTHRHDRKRWARTGAGRGYQTGRASSASSADPPIPPCELAHAIGARSGSADSNQHRKLAQLAQPAQVATNLPRIVSDSR